VATKQKYLNQFRALSTQLGLSPASRAQLAGLKIEQKNEEEDPLLKLLKS
ncbi:P27 family phage terminase small subunit, partial [Bacillus subtilis KCTC 1028 = ATCC 6051a]|nr:P27 family phage terminase small subunit [Bacillus subtilis KCTC 1028 = ATCC 6051a]